MSSAFPAPSIKKMKIVPGPGAPSGAAPKVRTIHTFDKMRAVAAYLAFGTDYPRIAQIVNVIDQKEIRTFFESEDARILIKESLENPKKVLPTHATIYSLLHMEVLNAGKTADRLKAIDKIIDIIGAPKGAGALHKYKTG